MAISRWVLATIQTITIRLPPSPYSLNRPPDLSPRIMGSSINTLCENLSLSEAEAIAVEIDDDELTPSKFTLVGRFVMRKGIGASDLTTALRRVWRLENSLKVSAIGEGVFVFDFEEESEMNRVFHQQPWNLTGSLIAMAKMVDLSRVADLRLTVVPFWVQLHGLQMCTTNRIVGRRVCEKVGRVLAVDNSVGDGIWGKCVRVRMLVDVTKPIHRSSLVVVKRQKVRIVFRYEKMGFFCSYCGKLDHRDRDCPKSLGMIDMGLEPSVEYPAWLKADGQRGLTNAEWEEAIRIMSVGEQRQKENLDRPGPSRADKGKAVMTENPLVPFPPRKPGGIVIGAPKKVQNFTEFFPTNTHINTGFLEESADSTSQAGEGALLAKAGPPSNQQYGINPMQAVLNDGGIIPPPEPYRPPVQIPGLGSTHIPNLNQSPYMRQILAYEEAMYGAGPEFPPVKKRGRGKGIFTEAIWKEFAEMEATREMKEEPNDEFGAGFLGIGPSSGKAAARVPKDEMMDDHDEGDDNFEAKSGKGQLRPRP